MMDPLPDFGDAGLDLHKERNIILCKMLAAMTWTLMIFVGISSFTAWYVFVYEETTVDWVLSETTSYPAPAVTEFSCAKLNNSVYLVGGLIDYQGYNGLASNRTLRFNITSHEWEEVDPLPYPLYHHVIKPYRDSIFSFGGVYLDQNETKIASNHILRYNSTIDLWEFAGMMPRRRWGHGVGIQGTKAFVIGGCDDFTFHTQIDVCDLITLRCSETEWSLPRVIYSFTVIELPRGILILGGITKSGDTLSDVLLFNPETGIISNTFFPALPFHADSPSVGVHENDIYIFGGNYTGDSALISFQKKLFWFNLRNNVWEPLEKTLMYPRGYASVVSLTDTTIGIFGGKNSTVIFNSVELYTKTTKKVRPLDQE